MTNFRGGAHGAEHGHDYGFWAVPQAWRSPKRIPRLRLPAFTLFDHHQNTGKYYIAIAVAILISAAAPGRP